jgi:hypothetical protein
VKNILKIAGGLVLALVIGYALYIGGLLVVIASSNGAVAFVR